MAWTGKSGWSGKWFRGSNNCGAIVKPSANRRRQRSATRQAESLEARVLLSGAGTPELLDSPLTVEINGFPEGPASISSAGDVNGDGVDDLIVGVGYGAPNGVFSSGQSYVVFGTNEPSGAPLNVGSLDGIDGFVINGSSEAGYAGRSVSSAGDFNGDGFDDLIVSEHYDGGAHVIFGRRDFEAAVELSSIDSTREFQIYGGGALTGYEVTGVGDFNGDGLADVVFEASFRPSSTNSGVVFVVFGQTDPAERILLNELDGADGFRVAGSGMWQKLGRWADSAGDVNADGIDDLVLSSGRGISQPFEDAIVIFGTTSAMPPVLSDTDLDGSNGFVVTAASESEYWYSVEGVGDFDGDGLADFAAQGEIIFGTDTGFPMEAGGVLADSADSVTLNGSCDAVPSNVNRLHVVAAGDFNGDGFDDMAISDSLDYATTGSIYIVFGRPPNDDFRSGQTREGNDAVTVLRTSDFAVDVLVGGQGDDTLNSDSGPDVLYGGEGDDLLIHEDLAFRRISGGSGFDTVDFSQVSSPIDLTTIPDSRLTDIEAIDLSDDRPDTLVVNRLEVLNLSSTSNTVRVFKDADDVVDMGDGWTQQDSVVDDWQAFDVFTQGEARLEVQAPIPSILPTIDGTRGVHIAPGDDDRLIGGDVQNAGDVNGDGFDDLLVKTRPSKFAASDTAYYVVFGSAEPFADPFVAATSLNGSNGFKISAESSAYRVISVLPVGDFNADGFSDLAVTTTASSAQAETLSSPLLREMHIVLGQAEPFTADFDSRLLDGSNGFTVQIDTESVVRGFKSSSPGDINGDGFEDFLLTGRLASPEDIAERRDGEPVAFLLFGHSTDTFESFTLDEFGQSHGVRIDAADENSLSSLKKSTTERVDINGDCIDDLFLESWRYTDVTYSWDRTYRQYVVFGTEEWPERIELSEWQGSDGFRIVQTDASRRLRG